MNPPNYRDPSVSTYSKDNQHVRTTRHCHHRTNAVAEEVGGTGIVSDFESLDDVRTLADTLLSTYLRIDLLANNAGGMYNTRALTGDGHERTLQTNYLAPFLLTRLLLPRLVESGGRVVSTSSNANVQGKIDLDDLNFSRRWNSGLGAYGASKLAINLFITELATRSTLSAFTFHPGFVRTGLAPDWWLLRAVKAATFGRCGVAPEVVAAQFIRLAADESISDPIGTYFDRLKPNGKQGGQATDRQLSSDLWNRTSALVGLPADL
ncbi:SDR family NAD(P)-dependent oxidoreductase [Rhodococcus wratislaviensis]|uniref:SDR family NAD(P)-dependent oxidoreductase n=1 Tax=Rhodococcus wratislaviensis TaxID=44752 RepID=UPI0020D183D9|nr:SDR family NAD(P)-dependent oxidoreductase [Rhodococcus wratislaviensis]